MALAEIREHAEILKEIKVALEIESYDSGELEELTGHIGEGDFETGLDGQDYRFILESVIWDIYIESITDLIKECYLGSTDLPWWIDIDWESTAKNCKIDGYGHHFSGYDGSERNVGKGDNGYYIFCVN